MKNNIIWTVFLLFVALAVSWPFVKAFTSMRACGWEAIFIECRITTPAK